jgi:hypothetical protein
MGIVGKIKTGMSARPCPQASVSPPWPSPLCPRGSSCRTSGRTGHPARRQTRQCGHSALVEINEEKKLVRKLPTPEQAADWVSQAKTLPRVVTH